MRREPESARPKYEGHSQPARPMVLQRGSTSSRDLSRHVRPPTAQNMASSQVKFPSPLPNTPLKAPHTAVPSLKFFASDPEDSQSKIMGSQTQRNPETKQSKPAEAPSTPTTDRPQTARVRMLLPSKSMLIQPKLDSPLKASQPAFVGPGSSFTDALIRPATSAFSREKEVPLEATPVPGENWPVFSKKAPALFFNQPVDVEQPVRATEEPPAETLILGLSDVSSDESRDWDLKDSSSENQGAANRTVEIQTEQPSPTKEIAASVSLKNLARSQVGISQEQLRPLILTRNTGCEHEFGEIGRLIAEALQEVDSEFDNTNQRHVQKAILAKPQLCKLLASSCYLTLKMGCDAISDDDIQKSLVACGYDWSLPERTDTEKDKSARVEMKQTILKACLGLLEQVQEKNQGNLWTLSVLTNCWAKTKYPKLKQQVFPDVQQRVLLGAPMPQWTNHQIATLLDNIEKCDQRDQVFMLRGLLCVVGTHPNFQATCALVKPSCNIYLLLVNTVKILSTEVETPEQILKCLMHIKMPASTDPEFAKLCEDTKSLIRKLPINQKIKDNDSAFEMELMRNPDYPSFLIDHLMQSIYESSSKDREAMRGNLIKFKTVPPSTTQALATVQKLVEEFLTSDAQELFLDFLLKQSESLLMLGFKVLPKSSAQDGEPSLSGITRILQVLVDSIRKLLQGQFSAASKVLDIAVRCQHGVCVQLHDLKKFAQVQELASLIAELPTPDTFREKLAEQTKLTQELPAYRLRIQKLVNLFQTEFKQLVVSDQSRFEKILLLLGDQSLSTREQLKLVDELGLHKTILRSADLMGFRPYKWYFRDFRFKNFGSESSGTATKFSEVASRAEQAVKSLLEELCEKLSKPQLDKIYFKEDVQKGPRSNLHTNQLIMWLEGSPWADLLTQYELISPDALQTLVAGLRSFEIVCAASDLKETYLKCKEYLTKKSAFKDDPEFERFVEMLGGAWTEYRDKGEIPTQKLAKFYADRSFPSAEVFESLNFHKNMGKIIPLLVEFFNKDNYHFQDINTSPETEGRVSPNVVNAVQQLVQIAREFSGTHNVTEFVSKFWKQEKHLSATLEEIVQEKDKLLEVSRAVHFSSAGEILKAFKIMKNSVFVFNARHEPAEYVVSCVLNKSVQDAHIGKLMRVNATNSNAKTEEIFTEDQLSDLEHRIALMRGRNFQSDMKSQQNSSESQTPSDEAEDLNCDEFLDVIEGIKKIKKNLVNILRAGTIHALEPILNMKSREKPNEKSVKRFPELEMMLSNQCIREAGMSLSIQTQHIESNPLQAPSQNQRNRSNLAVVADVIEAVEQDERTQLFNSNLQYHNITNLKSNQRIMLCKNTVVQPPETSKNMEDVLRLVNHMLPGANVSEMTLNETISRINSEHEDSGFTSDALTQLISTLAQVDPNVKPKKLVFPKKPDHKAPPKSIYYLEIKPADQYLRLNQLVVGKQFQPLRSDQVLFGSVKTTKEELGEFLIRAIFDDDKNPYFYLDLQLVPFEVLACLVEDCIKYLDKPHMVLNTNVFLFVTDVHDNLHLKEKPEYFSKESFDGLSTSILTIKLRPRNINYQVIYSDYAGMGKSTLIKKTLKNCNVQTVFFSGDPMSAEGKDRFELVEQAARSQNPLSIHLKIDMMDNMEDSLKRLDQILYSLVYLKSVTVRGLSVSLPKLQNCFVEVQNSYKDLILDRVRMLDPNFAARHCIPRLSEHTLAKQLDMTIWEDRFVAQRTVADQLDPSGSLEEEARKLKWVEFLHLFWIQYKNGRYGDAPIDQKLLDNQGWLDQNAPENKLKDTLISMLIESARLSAQNYENFGVFAEYLTFQQLRNWARSLFFQIREFEAVVGANPLIHHKAQSQEFFDHLSRSRNIMAKTTLAFTFKLICDVPIALNQETEKAQPLAEALAKANNQISNTDQKLLSLLESKIPKFGDRTQVNYFFYKSSIGVIYRNLGDVPEDVQALVKEQTKKKLLDFSNSAVSDLGEKMIVELIKSLHLSSRPGLIDKLSAHNRYKRLKTHDLRALQYYKDHFKEFNSKKGFNITKDNLPKILTVFQRMLLGMPIVIMGATGCGKTYMIDFMASCLLEDHFECFTLHTGVTEEHLEEKLLACIKAAKSPQNKNRRVWLFFDEFNTSPLQCLIAEIMIDRKSTFCKSLRIEYFPDNLVFVAACNPFRIKANSSRTDSPGLIAERSESVLTHRVFPLPKSLLYYTIDFGELPPEFEEEYTMSLAPFSSKSQKELTKMEQNILRGINICQAEFKKETSTCTSSLRDVKRFFEVHSFLEAYFESNPEKSLVLTIAICYIFKLETNQAKVDLQNRLDAELNLSKKFSNLLEQALTEFTKDLSSLGVVSKDTALNKPLRENLIALWVCINKKIPILICGKPGTSKSLAVKIIIDAMSLPLNALKDSEFFKAGPQMQLVKFWGHEFTTSEAIRLCFDKAKQLHDSMNKKERQTNVAIVFDEIGLAELAPTNPLKVLHPLLEPKEVKTSFIGISNYKLDASKTNRLVYVGRPEMDAEDLSSTCDFGSLELLQVVPTRKPEIVRLAKEALLSFVKSFQRFRELELSDYDPKGHPNFHGSRDFYETVKMFKRNLATIVEDTQQLEEHRDDERIIFRLMVNAIQRNFAGKVINKQECFRIVTDYFKEVFRPTRDISVNFQHSVDLIYQNLMDTKSRHLMIVSESHAVQEVLVSMMREFTVNYKRQDPSTFVYLNRGIGNPETIKAMESELPVYITKGYTLVLRELPEIYGSMYDLLNLNKTKAKSSSKLMVQIDRPLPAEQEGDEEYMCEIVSGGRSRRLKVNPLFKCIILMKETNEIMPEHQRNRSQDPPLMNRFEKIRITDKDYILPHLEPVLKVLQANYLPSGDAKTSFVGGVPAEALMHNLSMELLFSAVVDNSDTLGRRLKNDQQEFSIKQVLQGILSPMTTKLRPIRPLADGDDQITILQVAEQRLRPMLSRNYLFLQALGRIEVPKGFKSAEDFERHHNHNSLSDLIARMNKEKSVTRAFVCTYTSLIGLRDLARSPNSRFSLLESAELLKKADSEKITFIESALDHSTDSRALVVQFTKKSDWATIQQMKFVFDKIIQKKRSSKPVIFVAQYMLGDFKHQGHAYQSKITLFDDKWLMVAIDDLAGCDHPGFVQLLNSTCYEQLEFLKKEKVVQEVLESKFMEMVHTENRLQRMGFLTQLFEKSQPALERIAEASFKMMETNPKRVKDLFANTDLGKLFQTEIDSKRVITTELQRYLKRSVQETIKSQGLLNQLDFQSLFVLSAVNSPEHTDFFMRGFNDKICEIVEQCGGSEQSRIFDAIPLITNIGWDMVESGFRNTFRTLKTELGELGDQLKTAEVSTHLKGYQNYTRNPAEIFMRHNFKDTVVLQTKVSQELLGAYMFAKWAEQKRPQFYKYPLLELIIHLGVQLSKARFEPKYANFVHFFGVLYMITLNFEKEFLSLADHMPQFSTAERRELEAGSSKSFLTKGRIDLTEYIRSIQVLKRMLLNEPDHASFWCNKRKVQQSYKLHLSSSPEPQPLVVAQHAVMSNLLQFIEVSNLHNETAVIEDFNESLNEGSNYAHIALQVISNWCEDLRINLDLKQSAVKFCWGSLLELDSLDPLTYFERICNILMTIISKQLVSKPVTTFPTDQDIFGLSYLAKLIIDNYRRDSEVQTIVHQIVQNHTVTSLRLFYLLLNYKMMCIAFTNLSDFHHPDETDALAGQQVVSCLDTIKTCLSSCVLPFTRPQVKAFCKVREALISLRNNSGTTNRTLLEGINKKVESLAIGAAGQSSQVKANPLSLFLLQAIYIQFPSVELLTSKGFLGVAEFIRKLTSRSENVFVNSYQNEAKDAETAFQGFVTAATQGQQRSLQRFSQSIPLSNLVWDNQLATQQSSALKNSLSHTLFGQHLNITLEQQHAISADELPIRATISAVWGFLECLPTNCVYSFKSNKMQPNNFLAMVNYPDHRLLKYYPVVEYAQRTRTNDYRTEQVGAIWECTTPNCTGIIAMGNCGELGHAGHTSISSKCPECKKIIGYKGQGVDPGIKKLNLRELTRDCQKWMAEDEQPYRIEPITQAQPFDESWILMKYSSTIQDRTTALFVSLLQHMIYLAVEQLQKQGEARVTDMLPLGNTTDTRTLIVRQFGILAETLGKQPQALYEIFTLVLLSVCRQVGSNFELLSIPERMRSMLAQHFREVVMPPAGQADPKPLEDYYGKKHQLLAKNRSENAELMSLLTGTMPMQELKKLYRGKEEVVFGLVLNNTQAVVLWQQVHSRLEQNVRTGDDLSKIRSQFLIDLVSQQQTIRQFKDAIIGVKRFTVFLANKFDSKYTIAQAQQTSMRSAIDSCSEDQKKQAEGEFTRFCDLLHKKVLPDGPIKDYIEAHYGFQCEEVQKATEHIESLTKETTPLIYFVVHADRSEEEEPPFLQMLLEVLLRLQNEYISKYAQLACSRPAHTFAHTKTLFSSSDRALMNVYGDVEKDLIRHSSVESTSVVTRGQLFVDCEFLSNKYAEQLFGEAQLLRVNPNFAFKDSRKRALPELLKVLWTIYPQIKLETDPGAVEELRGTMAELGCLHNLIVLALASIVEDRTDMVITENTTIKELLPAECFLSDWVGEVTGKICIKDLEIIKLRLKLKKYEPVVKLLKENFSENLSSTLATALKQQGAKFARLEAKTLHRWIQDTKLGLLEIFDLKSVTEASKIQHTRALLAQLAEDTIHEPFWEPILRILSELQIDSANFVMKDLVSLIDTLESL